MALAAAFELPTQSGTLKDEVLLVMGNSSAIPVRVQQVSRVPTIYQAIVTVKGYLRARSSWIRQALRAQHVWYGGTICQKAGSGVGDLVANDKGCLRARLFGIRQALTFKGPS